MHSEAKTSKQSNAPLWWIVIIVLFPGLLALILFYADWRPKQVNVYGELLKPPISVKWQPLWQALPSQTSVESKKSWTWQATQSEPLKKWSLVWFAPNPCDSECVKSLYVLRAIHIGQGERSLRVQRIALTAEEALAHQWANNDQGLISLWVKPVAWNAMVKQLGNGMAIIDPQGHLVLRYPLGSDFNRIKKELKKLLKHSSQG